jgi:Holliday junction resolvase RusA-like endonuclease
MITFTIYGEPVAQGRPKLSTLCGHARAYDPKKSRDFKTYVKLAAQEHRPDVLLSGPVILTVKVFRSIPKSFSVKKSGEAEVGNLRPTTKPDLKNYIAGVEDALNQVIYVDDSQVIEYGRSGKWYSFTPRVEITVEEV